MKPTEALLSGSLPEKDKLSQNEFEKLVWAFRGVVKEQQRDRAFWSATNENLKTAFERLAEKDRELNQAYATIQQDLAVASRLQESLLPVPSDKMAEEVEIAVFHRQLADVGGDYYDFFTTKNGRYAIGVFDISGHGVSAALVMTYLKAQFMTVIEGLASPAEIVRWVNEVSLSFMQTVKKYAAVNFVQFGAESIRYVNGGGNGLLISDSSSVSFSKRDQFLGLRQRPFHEYRLAYEPGDLLALYTDGIIEAQNSTGKDYSKGRLDKLIFANRHRKVEEILHSCVEDYRGFRVKDSDDITLVLVRRRG